LEKSLDPIPKDAAGVLKVRNYLKKVMNFNTEMNQLEQKLKL
jgi:hypothetical protein